MKATFESSVNVLVKAYFNGTLEHGNCTACAVGNLIADKMGCKPVLMSSMGSHTRTGQMEWSNHVTPQWLDVFVRSSPNVVQRQRPEAYTGEAKKQIDLTGYTWQQLAMVENVFESKRVVLGDSEEIMGARFNGLMAVVDVLADIHGINLEAKESAKLLFVKL